MNRHQLLTFAALLVAPLAALHAADARQQPIFNIRTYGATGDGTTLDTKSVQEAIAACHAAGGGIVEVPAGDYHVGTLKMLSNVTLKLNEGASLLGSKTIENYVAEAGGVAEEPAFQKCLIQAENATHIGFQGAGLIDGRGSLGAFPVKVNGKIAERPTMMRLVNCKQVNFAGVTFKNPASWGLHLVECQNVHFDGITIQSRDNNANNDGIDLDGCRDVVIENCRINSGDDAVCLKSTTKQPCSNIVVRSCQLSSKTAGFKLGTSSRSGFVDIQVTDSRFHDCPMGAIKLLLVDGGRLENVELERLTMEEVGGPIFIRLGNRGRLYERPIAQIYKKDVKPEGAPVGVIRGVTIKDVTARVSGKDLDRQGIMITGIPGHRVQDVTLENIQIRFPGGGTREAAVRQVPEDIARYPEQYFFGVLPDWGLFVRHADGIRLRNLKLDCDAEDARPPAHLEDVSRWDARDLLINGIRTSVEPPLNQPGTHPAADVSARVASPKIAGPYVRVYLPKEDVFPGPDSGHFKAGQSYAEWVPNDLTILKGADGRWHGLGITHPKPPDFDPPRYGKDVHEAEWLLFHAVAPAGKLKEHLNNGAWGDARKVLAPAERLGEPLACHAPFILQKDGLYHMIYGPSPLRMATSADLYNWKPAGALFEQKGGARDPSVILHEGRYILFYVTGNAVLARTSPDLRNWSTNAVEIFRMRRGGDPESPSMVERDGQFYLFICLWDAKDEPNGAYDNRTFVFRSANPLDFQKAPCVAELQAHAPEIFRDEDGDWFISSVEWPYRGASIAPLTWEWRTMNKAKVTFGSKDTP